MQLVARCRKTETSILARFSRQQSPNAVKVLNGLRAVKTGYGSFEFNLLYPCSDTHTVTASTTTSAVYTIFFIPILFVLIME